MEKKYDLEERCCVFAAAVVKHTDSMPNTKAGNHLAGQLLRSGTAPALHYGEVQGAESPRDFIHKMRGALKELRESKNNLKVQLLCGMLDTKNQEHAWLIQECGELVAIFTSSVKQPNATTPRSDTDIVGPPICTSTFFIFHSSPHHALSQPPRLITHQRPSSPSA